MASSVQPVYNVRTVRERFDFRFEKGLADDLRHAAKIQGVTLTRYVEQALENHLGRGSGGTDLEDIERRLARLEELANL